MKKNINAMPIDALQIFAENTNITASGVFGAVVDLKGLGFGKATLVMDVAVADAADADEVYSVGVEFSEDLAFSTPVQDQVIDIPRGVLGRKLQPINNQIGDTMYRYVRLNLVLAGTTPSLTMTSFISEDIKMMVR